MKGMIVYYSDYGSTRDYMEALSHHLGWPALPMKEAKRPDIKNVDCVVLASNVIAGRMAIGKWAKKHEKKLTNKIILAVPVGAAPEEKKDLYLENVKKSLGFLNIPENRVFPLQGRKIFSEMKGIHKFMMKMVSKMIKDPDDKKLMLTEIREINLDSLTKILAFVNNS